MNKEEKIHKAADMIADRLYGRGWPSPGDCLEIARLLYDLWERNHEIRNVAPGEIAQRYRERYTHEEARSDDRD